MIEFFVEAGELFGIPKSVAAIYGILFASPVALSFADIANKLDISQGSLSQGVRVLREVGALKVVGTRERRDYFTTDMELRKLASRFIEDRLEKQLQAGSERLRAMSATVPHGAARHELISRLRNLKSWHDKSAALIPIVKAFLKVP